MLNVIAESVDFDVAVSTEHKSIEVRTNLTFKACIMYA